MGCIPLPAWPRGTPGGQTLQCGLESAELETVQGWLDMSPLTLALEQELSVSSPQMENRGLD